MKKYEIMAIIANKLDEKQAKEAAKEGLIDFISELGGKITFEDFWGAKGFAYKINGEKWGYYCVYQFEISPQKLVELEKSLNINNNIIRFLISKVEKNEPAPTKYSSLQKSKPQEEKIDKIEEQRTAKKPGQPIKTDEVDKKLDKIFDDASIGL